MARSVTVNIPHNLGRDEARKRIGDGFGRLRQQMTGGMAGIVSFTEQWEDNRLHFAGGAMGQKVTGRLDVLEDSVQIQLDLPEFLAAIAQQLSERLKRESQKLLESRD